MGDPIFLVEIGSGMTQKTMYLGNNLRGVKDRKMFLSHTLTPPCKMALCRLEICKHTLPFETHQGSGLSVLAFTTSPGRAGDGEDIQIPNSFKYL